MPTFPYTFSALAGNIPASDLDANFAVCAFASDLTALTVVVTALPSSSTPLIPLAGGAAGGAATLSRSDHQHPPQPATQNLQTGTTYTLVSSDDGKVVDILNAGAITLTLPNSFPVGYSCLVTQAGAGQITFSVAGGGSFRQRQSYTKTAGQWGVVTLYVRANAGGTAAEWVAAGDMA